mmetsp:Transcript_28763/g.55605  ORF Transcript_28763/g.55605 Transcript_28763/m.55605 type:complete len:97 (+) Transcript_28763:1197-1487(+)
MDSRADKLLRTPQLAIRSPCLFAGSVAQQQFLCIADLLCTGEQSCQVAQQSEKMQSPSSVGGKVESLSADSERWCVQQLRKARAESCTASARRIAA